MGMNKEHTSPYVLQLNEQKSNEEGNIRNVWFENFEAELPVISELLEKYPYIAMVSYPKFNLML